MAAGTRPRTRAFLGEGAAEAAPTAPHATPRARTKGESRRRKRSGPERFWDPRRVRVAFGVMLALSAAAHYAVSPWSLVPDKVEIKDGEGEATIPIDVFLEDEPPPPVEDEKKAAEAAQRDEKETTKEGWAITGDAAVAQAGIVDAGKDGPSVALAPVVDAAPPPVDAGSDAPVEAGPPTLSLDPQAVVGADVRAGDPMVVLTLNMEAIKAHPIGRNMGDVLRSIPQWDEFMAGTNIDPVRDTDWMMVSGPSLRDTTKDVILIHYSAADAVVDEAIATVARKYPGGGAFDAGVPNVRAALGHADGAPRVFVRPQPRLVAVVPVDVAAKTAKALARSRVRAHLTLGEAFRMRLLTPSAVITLLPPTLKELRLWVLPRPDGGAEMFAEGDCATEAEAVEASEKVKTTVRSFTSNILVKVMTRGLFDTLDVRPDGKTVKVHLVPTQSQLDSLLTLVAAQIKEAKSAPAK